MGREDVDTLLTELSQSNTATQLDDGLWMRAHAQQSRDALPGQRRKHSGSSSKKAGASLTVTDARQHGQSCFKILQLLFPKAGNPFEYRPNYGF